MNEPSFLGKDEIHDTSDVHHRLSESRPKFKPVLVKKLLADESDDDSDDQASNSDHSDEESDDFDGFQPLPDEAIDDVTSKPSTINSDVKIDVFLKSEEAAVSNIGNNEVDNVKIVSEIQLSEKNEDIKHEEKSVLNTYLKDSLKISEYTVKRNEEEKLLLDKPMSGAKRKSSKDFNDQENLTLQSQWQPKSYVVDKRKSLFAKEENELNKLKSYSPDIKRHSHNSVLNQIDEVKDKPIQHFESFADFKINYEASKQKESHVHNSSNLNYPRSINTEISDEKIASKVSIDQSNNKTATSQTSSAHHTVMETPMKHPQGSTRPNPCLSHRNIFQTPQNKTGNEFAKNSIQTPATIFSHWSQQHLPQTPMQNQNPVSKESLQTPAPSIVQSAKHETPRYFTSEGKSVRRPLAETMHSGTSHGSQLPKLQEVANESQGSPLISTENNCPVIKENIPEKKSIYSSSHAVHETKENRNPNPHEIVKNESQSKQPILSASESRYSTTSQTDSKPKSDHQIVYQSNVKVSRVVETYENYQKRESQSVQQSTKSQQEQVIKIPRSIPQQINPYNNSRQRIITVQDHQYLVLGVLGQGMSCEVVRTQDLSNSELRAIKCVDLSKMDKDSVKGCLQEICMLDKLRAPCIVHMYNFEIKQPMVHVVMEVGDTDLSRLLKSMLNEKKKIPLTMILYYWTEMLTAVKHIHENGVIHSDLKPANFLLVRGRLKLIDFGIASNINADMTSVVKNCPIGTLNYISPEALMDVNAGNNESPNHNVKYKISYKSDVWSLGCILYVLVYGITPFNHIRQQWAKISAITDPKHKINFPLQNGTEPVPLILIDVMRKCLQRDPKARPTVTDLLEIPYLQSNIISNPIVHNIPQNIMMKIRHALSEDEWQALIAILDKK